VYFNVKETISEISKFSGKFFSQCLLFKNVFGSGDFTNLSVIPFLKMRFLYGKIFWKGNFYGGF
jgi:hypothetical protein